MSNLKKLFYFLTTYHFAIFILIFDICLFLFFLVMACLGNYQVDFFILYCSLALLLIQLTRSIRLKGYIYIIIIELFLAGGLVSMCFICNIVNQIERFSESIRVISILLVWFSISLELWKCIKYDIDNGK